MRKKIINAVTQRESMNFQVNLVLKNLVFKSLSTTHTDLDVLYAIVQIVLKDCPNLGLDYHRWNYRTPHLTKEIVI